MDLQVPQDFPSLQWAMGIFSHYSRWITNFPDELDPLITHTEQTDAFKNWRRRWWHASEHAIIACLTPNSQLVTFISRVLTSAELKYSAIEKEKYAIIEAIWKWWHLLLGKQFKLVTDKKKSVSFMFNCKSNSKIKKRDHKMETRSCLFQLQHSVSPRKTKYSCGHPVSNLLFYHLYREAIYLAQRFMSPRSNPNGTFHQK